MCVCVRVRVRVCDECKEGGMVNHCAIHVTSLQTHRRQTNM